MYPSELRPPFPAGAHSGASRKWNQPQRVLGAPSPPAPGALGLASPECLFPGKIQET